MGLVPVPVFFVLRTLVFFSNYFFDVESKCTGLMQILPLQLTGCVPLGRPEFRGFLFVCFSFFLAF